MKIKTDELRVVVEKLLPAISKKDLVAQMSKIIFKDDIAGTFNDQIAISYPLDLGGSTCSVPAEDLSKVLSGIKEEEINIEFTDGQMLLTSDSTSAEISTISESKAVEEFYDSLDLASMEWRPLPKDFIEKLNLAKFSTSNNTYDPQNLFCIAIGKDHLFSGDGYRCTKIKCQTKVPETILIPQSSVSSIIKFADVTEYAIAYGWIHFANPEDVVVSSRIVKGKFPNMTEILKQFPGGEKIKISRELIPILDNIDKILPGEADFLRVVSIAIKKGVTIVTGKKEGLSIKKTIKNDFTTDIVKFDISPSFLSKLLLQNITDSLQVANDMALFRGSNFEHLVTLPFEE